MTDHDPLCPWDEDELPGRQHCACDLIARVRADEREKDRQLMRNALDNERERIAQAIEAMRPYGRPTAAIIDTLAAVARIAREGTP